MRPAIFARPMHDAVTRCDLASYAQRLCLLGPERAAAAVRPQQMNAVARHDAEGEVRLVLEHCLRRCDNDVREKRIFGVDCRRSVKRGDHRYRNVDQIQQNLLTLAVNFVVSAR